MRILILFLTVVFSGCASIESTKTAPDIRDKYLSNSRCDVTLKRMNNFVKYFPPSSGSALEYIMYQDGKVGVRGYDMLGDLYFNGCPSANLKPDKNLAAYWYLNAANAHVPEAQYKLGKMLYEGDGVEKDETAGADWLVSSALEQNVEARKYLSDLGIDVPYTAGLNTYDRIQAELLRQRKQQNAIYWQGFLTDLFGVVVLAAATYVALEATTPVYYTSRTTPTPSPPPTTIYRYKPVWCTSTGSAYVTGNYIRGTVSTFCN